jgi:hypothetical protein
MIYLTGIENPSDEDGYDRHNIHLSNKICLNRELLILDCAFFVFNVCYLTITLTVKVLIGDTPVSQGR